MRLTRLLSLAAVPLVMFFLDRVGIVDAGVYRRHRRLAVFLLFVLAAVLTVTPDMVGMLSLALPLWLLYQVGIVLCRWSGRGTTVSEESSQGKEIHAAGPFWG